MTFKTAQDAFEEAQQVAEGNNNAALALIASGLIDLTKAIKAEFRDIEQKVNAVESKVRNLR